MTVNMNLSQAKKNDELAWQNELAQLQREQADDLKNAKLSWWEPGQMSEAEYFEMMSEAYQ